MLAAIKLFLGEKVFNMTGMFILGLIAIIGIFVFYNSDTILAKFGFETSATLKAEVSRLDTELKQSKGIIDNLNKTIETMDKRGKDETKAIADIFKEKEVIKETVIKVVKKKQSDDRKVVEDLTKKTVETSDSITLPLAEYNTISENNINAIHEAYAKFAPTTT